LKFFFVHFFLGKRRQKLLGYVGFGGEGKVGGKGSSSLPILNKTEKNMNRIF
jgi:hypothetical protein